MRRARDLWARIVSFENLVSAAHRAARGKRRVASVARFLERLEPEVLALQRELEAGYARRPAATFQIVDPKERTISVSPFPDRVVDHAAIRPLEPIFERRMVPASFACRRGKGTHAALRRAEELLRGHERFLKLDVHHCFESLRHDVVLETVARVVKDRRVLDLFERIVRTPQGRGLPIGALTSQWLANLVLDRLDHHVKEVLRIGTYVRYLDDFVLFSDDRDRLARAAQDIAAYLAHPLGLALKASATVHAPAWQGLPFLGWRIYPGTVRLRPENLRRTRQRLARRLRQHAAGEIDEAQIAGAVRSVAAHMEHGTTRALRRRWFEPP